MKIFFVFSIILFSFLGIISSLQVEISIKNSFSVGENVTFNYTFIPDETKNVNYYVGAECASQTNFPSMLQISLTAGQRAVREYVGFVIEDGIAYQECSAFVIWEGNIANQSFTKEFVVENNMTDSTPNNNLGGGNGDEDDNTNNGGSPVDNPLLDIDNNPNPPNQTPGNIFLGTEEVSDSLISIVIYIIIIIIIIVALVIVIWFLKKKRENAINEFEENS